MVMGAIKATLRHVFQADCVRNVHQNVYHNPRYGGLNSAGGAKMLNKIKNLTESGMAEEVSVVSDATHIFISYLSKSCVSFCASFCEPISQAKWGAL